MLFGKVKLYLIIEKLYKGKCIISPFIYLVEVCLSVDRIHVHGMSVFRLIGFIFMGQPRVGSRSVLPSPCIIITNSILILN